MQDPKITTAYRVILALSFALFIHVLLAMIIRGWLQLPPYPEPEPMTVRVRIAPPGNSPNQSAASQEDRQGNRPQPQTAEAGGQARIIGQDGGARVSPIEAPPETRTPQRPDISSASPESGSEDLASSFRQLFGSRSPDTQDPAEDEPVTRLSHADAQNLSDYEIKLWEKIAKKVRYKPVLENLKKPRRVTLELSLLDNGALRRVRIEESSGSEALDRLGRQAALAASPFPEPPDGSDSFRVRLIFQPPGAETP